MTDGVQRDLGALNARVTNVEGWMKSMAEDVKAMRTTLDQAKGGWKLALGIAAGSATIGAMVAKFLPLISMATK